MCWITCGGRIKGIGAKKEKAKENDDSPKLEKNKKTKEEFDEKMQ